MREMRERHREREKIASAQERERLSKYCRGYGGMPRNTCSAYNNNNKKKEKKEIKGGTKIHREPKWCGRESSKVALSPWQWSAKEKIPGNEAKKKHSTHTGVLCAGLCRSMAMQYL